MELVIQVGLSTAESSQNNFHAKLHLYQFPEFWLQMGVKEDHALLVNLSLNFRELVQMFWNHAYTGARLQKLDF
jgi:hypothetical protein